MYLSEKAPGQRECGAALESLNKQLRELDQVALQAVSQELEPRQANTLQGIYWVFQSHWFH